MQTDTITLRELTIRYAPKIDADGQPFVVGRKLTTPAECGSILLQLLQDQPCEVFAILCLSTKHRVIAYHEVSRGTLDATLSIRVRSLKRRYWRMRRRSCFVTIIQAVSRRPVPTTFN